MVRATSVRSLADSTGRYLVSSLTFDGHDFLDMSRSKEGWGRAKNIADKTGGMSFEIFKAVLTDLVKSAARNAAQGKPMY